MFPHSKFSVTNKKAEDIWKEPSNAGNRPLEFRSGRMKTLMSFRYSEAVRKCKKRTLWAAIYVMSIEFQRYMYLYLQSMNIRSMKTAFTKNAASKYVQLKLHYTSLQDTILIFISSEFSKVLSYLKSSLDPSTFRVNVEIL
jgi:hypothetical protein